MRQEGKPQFGRIPWELVDSGYLKKLTGRECKLLMALAAHMNGDWTGNPSAVRLAKLTGVDRRNISRLTKSLEAKLEGRLQVTRSKGGQGNVNTYRFTHPEPETNRAAHDAVSAAANPPNRAASDAVSPANRAASDAVSPGEPRHFEQDTAPPTTREQRNKKKKKKGARKATVPDPRVAEFIAWFAAEYLQAQGRKYVVGGKKDGQLVRVLLGRLAGNGHDPMMLLQRATKRMMTDEWGGPRASIGVLSSGINSWLATGGRRRRRSGQFMPTDPKAADFRPDDDYSTGKGST